MLRHLVFAPLVLVAAAVTGCAETAAGSNTNFAPSFSTSGDSSFQTSYVSRGASTVSRVSVDADVVVRPDRVCIPVQVYASSDDADAAMSLVKAAADKLASAGTLRVDDIDARSDRTEEGVRSTVSMRGVIETELKDGDAWSRAQQVSSLSRAVAAQATWEGKLFSDEKKNPLAHVIVGAPEPGVRDIEAHRGKLLESWTARAKALAAAAEGSLELVNCAPPAQVVVVGGTLEKVGLSLPVSCTFAVKK